MLSNIKYNKEMRRDSGLACDLAQYGFAYVGDAADGEIASAVIGGTLLTGGVGNVIGSLFGVLINGTITVLVNTNGKLLSSWANIATAALLCIFIIIQSVFALIKARNAK